MKKYLKNEKLGLTGMVRAVLRNTKTGKVRIIPWNYNTIMTVGKTAVLNRLGNIAAVSNEGIITYGAVGNGSTTPSISNTQMENELARNTLAKTSVSSTKLTIQVFFAEALANDTITKFALFGEDASASADSGTMFNYAIFSDSFTKTAIETLTVEIKFTLS